MSRVLLFEALKKKKTFKSTCGFEVRLPGAEHEYEVAI